MLSSEHWVENPWSCPCFDEEKRTAAIPSLVLCGVPRRCLGCGGNGTTGGWSPASQCRRKLDVDQSCCVIEIES